jgi:hypothetical protein
MDPDYHGYEDNKTLVDIEIQLLPKRIACRKDYLHETVLPEINKNVCKKLRWTSDLTKFYLNQALIMQ